MDCKTQQSHQAKQQAMAYVSLSDSDFGSASVILELVSIYLPSQPGILSHTTCAVTEECCHSFGNDSIALPCLPVRKRPHRYVTTCVLEVLCPSRGLWGLVHVSMPLCGKEKAGTIFCEIFWTKWTRKAQLIETTLHLASRPASAATPCVRLRC